MDRRGEPRIILERERLVVVDKPPGMLSVPGKGPDKGDCVISRVAERFPDASGPMVVHRLDMDTSGLMVLGLDAPTQRALSMQFESRTVAKRYVALVHGSVAPDEGVIDLPMRLDVDHRPIQIIDHERGRAARTRWRVLAREIDRTRVQFEPLTGRTHQLRVHAATPRDVGGLGCPIIGDVLYGHDDGAPRLMLHACRLSFVDPGSGRRIDVESPPPF